MLPYHLLSEAGGKDTRRSTHFVYLIAPTYTKAVDALAKGVRHFIFHSLLRLCDTHIMH